MMKESTLRSHLLEGLVLPALPLALDRYRRWSERRQRAVLRYYMDAGAGGVAVGVHSTQFEIREPQHGLFKPVLALASETIDQWRPASSRPFLKIAGVCGRTAQALAEAEFAAAHGYHAALLSLTAWKADDEDTILEHCREVAEQLPLIGFYLQPAVGGRPLSYRFWRRFAEIPAVVAIKIAPFNRYQTLDVVRAVADSGREELALYTGNDDNIVVDLLTPFELGGQTRFVSGGLLGQWGVWTERAVTLLEEIKRARSGATLEPRWLSCNAALTDANAAIFDAAHSFAGCLPGIHEILRRVGLFETTLCLNPEETLSPGQLDEIDRVMKVYPQFSDGAFVQQHLHRWLA